MGKDKNKDEDDNSGLHVNEKCIGCGACVAICNDVFDLNEDGLAFVKEGFNQEDPSIDDAINACPVAAIEK